MGEFVIGPLDVPDAEEFDVYNKRLTEDLRELIRTGEAKGVDGLDTFFEVSERMRTTIGTAAAEARLLGESSCTAHVPMTVAEHRMLGSVGTSLQTYMEILAMRGAVDVTPTPGVTRAMTALLSGRLEE